jgi:hypothetical protein
MSAFPTAAVVELKFVAHGTRTMLALGDSGLVPLLMAVRQGEVAPPCAEVNRHQGCLPASSICRRIFRTLRRARKPRAAACKPTTAYVRSRADNASWCCSCCIVALICSSPCSTFWSVACIFARSALMLVHKSPIDGSGDC